MFNINNLKKSVEQEVNKAVKKQLSKIKLNGRYSTKIDSKKGIIKIENLKGDDAHKIKKVFQKK